MQQLTEKFLLNIKDIVNKLNTIKSREKFCSNLFLHLRHDNVIYCGGKNFELKRVKSERDNSHYVPITH